ncbi:MAG: fibronectin type III domain-containing protein [Acidimicrobiia bacterium]
MEAALATRIAFVPSTHSLSGRDRESPMRNFFLSVGVSAAVLASLVVGAPAAGALPVTYHVTNSDCVGPGSISEAIAAANAHPGADTILIDVPRVYLFNGSANGDACTPPGRAPYAFHITESVTIDGQGAWISAQPIWFDSAGYPNNVQAGRCPAQSGDRLATAPVSFLEVGTYGQDNSGIEVTVAHLDVTSVSRLAEVWDNASLTFDAVKAESITDLSDSCNNPAISVETGGNLTIIDSWFNDSVMAAENGGGNAFIVGATAGNLTIRTSLFSDLRNQFSVMWSGLSTSRVAIVSSQFQGAGGIYVTGKNSGTMHAYVTNSIVRLGNTGIPADMNTSDLIESAGRDGGHAALHFQGSTIQMQQTSCHVSEISGQCARLGPGMIVTFAGGTIDFTHSAIGVGDPAAAGSNKYLFATGATGGPITADEYSWAQPTSLQNAAAIEAILGPSVITDTPGLYAGGFYPGDGAVTPLVNFGGSPGVLIDAIPDAKGVAPIGANALRDPITNDPILYDVFGNPRWDGNDKSNIGAIQTVFAPHLTVLDTGDGAVGLAWNQVNTGAPAYPVDKYVVRYRIAGSSDPFSTIEITDPTQLFTAVTGLVNGTKYEFVVRAHAVTIGDLPDSNIVEAIPYGPVEVPVTSAVGGDGEARVYWTDPDAGGHPGPLSYFVIYRPLGATEWFMGPGSLSARTTRIPELDPGTTYEFGVLAIATDGSMSREVGIATAATDPAPDPAPDDGDGGGATPRFTG